MNLTLEERISKYKLVVYVPEDKERLVKDLIEHCKANKPSLSQRIIAFLEETASKELGQIIEESRFCDLCNKEFKAGVKAKFASGAILIVCQECFKEKQAKRLVRMVYKAYE